MLTTKNIVVKKHARVFSFGDLKTAKEVWLLFHGYGQNIPDFFKPFETFSKDKTFIIPEGLSRFYQKGILGKTGASWMTTQDRDHEIIDQLNFLDTVYQQYELKGKKVNVFAFSQGVQTASRWIEKRKIELNRIVLWSGNTPKLIAENPNNWFNSQVLEFYIGNKDQFVQNEKWEEFFKLKSYYKPTYYEGDHFFNSELLKKFIFNL